MKVIVGSKNAAKVAATQMGVQAFWPNAEVTGEEVPSGVSAQPLSHEETLTGALNRARAAKALGCDLGVGLEGGVVDIAGTPIMMSYVAVTDGVRDVVVPANGTPLPQAWGQALKDGAELRPYVIASGLPYDYKTGVIGTLTHNTQNKISRDQMFANALMGALLPWVTPEAYASDNVEAAA